MKLNLSQKKFIDEVTLQKIIKIGINFGERLNTIDTKCIDDFSEDKLYLKGEACYKDGYIYRAVVSTQGAWVDSRWIKVGDDITELDIDTIKSYLNLSQQDLDNLQNLIDDAQITLTKTHSSSKIYMDIQQCLEDSKTYTLKEISRLSGASYKVVTSTSEMTSKSIIYLLPNATNYDMYIVEENGTATKIGNMDVDLSQYLTKSEIETDYLKKTDADGKYATITTVDGKVDKTNILTASSSTATDDQVYSAKAINTELDKVVKKTDIVTSINSASTDDKVSSAKSVYNELYIGTKVTQSFIDIYGNDILKFPKGRYDIRSAALSGKLTNIPTGEAGVLEISSIHDVEGNPFDTAWCQRIYKFEPYNGGLYIRTLQSNGIPGNWYVNTGWQKVCTTSVADVPKTKINFINGVINSTDNYYIVKNGICFVHLNSGNYSLGESVNGMEIANGLPIPAAGLCSHTYIPWAAGDVNKQVILFVDINGQLSLHATVSANGCSLYTSFSYPVAEE